VYTFGQFRLDPARLELSRGDVRLKLQEQPLRLLIRLVACAGEVVTRDDLYRELWPTDTFVAFDAGLSTAIKKIRQTLGDTASNPRFIETIPRHGYRFIAPVQILFPPAPSPGGETPVAAVETPLALSPAPLAATPPLNRRQKWLLPASVAAFAAAAWFLVPVMQRGLSGPEEMPPLRVTPLTSQIGNEMHPAVSPDGTQVAFAWDGGHALRSDLYLAGIGGGDVRRLTSDANNADFPCWSPDGSYLAYVRHQQDIMLISALGGTPRKLGEESGFSLAWSPDGSSVLFGERQSREESSPLWSVSVRTAEKRKLSTPVSAIYSFITFGFSPDGRRFGFGKRADAKAPFTLFAVPAEGGSAVRMASAGLPVRGWTWLSNHEIIVSTRTSGRWGLARLRLDRTPSAPTPLAGAGEGGSFPSIAFHPASGREPARPILAYQRNQTVTNLYSIAPPHGEATHLLASSSKDGSPQFSPDGQTIVFVSNRSGPEEIWQASSDGSHPVALTSFGAADTPPGSPKWSPDGHQIVFDVAATGHHRIYALSPDGGPSRMIVNWDCETIRPNWSRDGKWIYFGANLTGRYEIWKVPANQTDVAPAAAVRVTQDGGWEAAESVDGSRLFFVQNRYVNDLWEMPSAGGTAIRVIAGVVFHGWWSVTESGIYYADFTADLQPQAVVDAVRPILFYRFSTGRAEKVAAIPRPADRATPDFCTTRDGGRILYAQIDLSGSNIMIVEGLRR